MIELGERLGAGKEAEVFEHGANVAKLYREGVAEAVVRREAGNIAVAVRRGLPVPAVYEVKQFGTRWGIVMDRAPGTAFATRMQAATEQWSAYAAEMLRLHRAIHAQPGDGLLPMRARLRSKIDGAAILSAARRRLLLELLDTLPDGDRICHGDFHPFNIMGEPGAAMVIDWLDATSGPPAADVCRTYVLLDPHMRQFASDYVLAYADAAGLAEDEILRWAPVIAGARVVENVPEELDRLIAMTERL